MKKYKIKVSRQGLTRCPSCKAHIQVATPLTDTVCPFCQTHLAQALAASGSEQGPLTRLMGSSRSAVIAASLLGMPVIGACDNTTKPKPPDPGPNDAAAEPWADAAPDSGMVAVYGMPMDVAIEAGPSEDVIPTAEYGMPPDIIESDASEEPPPSEAYGMPPDMDE